jgi:hypothetical protein
MADQLSTVTVDAHKVILPNGGHACYMRATDQFHHHLLGFLVICLR